MAGLKLQLVRGTQGYAMARPGARASGTSRRALRFASVRDALDFLARFEGPANEAVLRALLRDDEVHGPGPVAPQRVRERVAWLLAAGRVRVLEPAARFQTHPLDRAQHAEAGAGEAPYEDNWTLSVNVLVPDPRGLSASFTTAEAPQDAYVEITTADDPQDAYVFIATADDPMDADAVIATEEAPQEADARIDTQDAPQEAEAAVTTTDAPLEAEATVTTEDAPREAEASVQPHPA